MGAFVPAACSAESCMSNRAPLTKFAVPPEVTGATFAAGVVPTSAALAFAPAALLFAANSETGD